MTAVRANATYRADFFDISKRPTVNFDKGHLTWTLRNQGVERVIHFDAKAGSLQTVLLRDLHTRHTLTPAPDGEGEITFASPLLQTPIPLTGWKYTALDPGSAWTQPDYNDKRWKPLPNDTRPVRADADVNAPVWFRVTLPADRLRAGHAYALYLPRGFWSEGEVYADGSLIQKYAAIRPRRLSEADQIDLPPGCKVIAIHGRNGSLHHVGTFLPAFTSEVGTSPPALNLAGGWQFMLHTINAGEDNSQILTVHLAGVKQYEGFDLDVCYQIHAGEEPTIAKWFSFVSHRKSRFLVDTVTCDRWMLPAAYSAPRLDANRDAPFFVQAVPDTGDVLLASQLDGLPCKPQPGEKESSDIALRAELNTAIKPELPLQTPRSLTAFWHGSEGTGLFLYQLYLGQYIARGRPDAVPIAYNTGFAYGSKINTALCEQAIPLAANLGAEAFVLGDGWQSNIPPDSGRYGDWITAKVNFPKGLLPISTLVRQNHMRFGLWLDAARVDRQSQAATQHPEWLKKGDAQYGAAGEDSGEHMCFTGAWARQFTQSALLLCREQTVTYLQTHFHPQDACLATDHEHPVGHSRTAEQDAWKVFCDTLHAANNTPTIVNQEAGYQAPTAPQDANDSEGWFQIMVDPAKRSLQDWEGQAALNTLYFTEPALNQDIYAYPYFARNGLAFCHRQTDKSIKPTRPDYFWTMAAAVYPAFEIQGDLTQMTPEERETGHKWIAWNRENRDWLAFTQPLALTPVPAPGSAPKKAEAKPEFVEGTHVSGLLHLRNALNGRYGYACVWNSSDAPVTLIPAFNPAEYFVRMKPEAVSLTDLRDNSPVPFSTRGGTFSLGKITLPPYGYAIYEIRAK